MKGNGTVSFSVTADAASAATDRFMLVFRSNGAPITHTAIKATEKNNDVVVEWQVTGEKGIKSYEVEHSADGSSFSKVATATAIANGAPVLTYTSVHTRPV
jgi:hypothetical protein